jgi:hypothetical protein
MNSQTYYFYAPAPIPEKQQLASVLQNDIILIVDSSTDQQTEQPQHQDDGNILSPSLTKNDQQMLLDWIAQTNDNAIDCMKNGKWIRSIGLLKQATSLLKNHLGAYERQSRMNPSVPCVPHTSRESHRSPSSLRNADSSTTVQTSQEISNTNSIISSDGIHNNAYGYHQTDTIPLSWKDDSEEHWIYQKVFPLSSSVRQYSPTMLSIIVLYHFGLCYHRLGYGTGQVFYLRRASDLYMLALKFLSSFTSSEDPLRADQDMYNKDKSLELVFMLACAHNVSCIGTYLYQNDVASDMRECVRQGYQSMINMRQQQLSSSGFSFFDDEDVVFFHTTLLMADMMNFFKLAPCA